MVEVSDHLGDVAEAFPAGHVVVAVALAPERHARLAARLRLELFPERLKVASWGCGLELGLGLRGCLSVGLESYHLVLSAVHDAHRAPHLFVWFSGWA